MVTEEVPPTGVQWILRLQWLYDHADLDTHAQRLDLLERIWTRSTQLDPTSVEGQALRRRLAINELAYEDHPDFSYSTDQAERTEDRSR
jgi:hypothetical protein